MLLLNNIVKGDFVLRYHKSNGEEVIMYTNEERESAMQVSLTSLARSLGYTPIKQGSLWTLKEMDSLKIHNDKTWYRWSGKGNRNGGTQIDFLMEFGGVDSPAEAIQQLLEFNGERIQEVYAEDNVKKKEPTEFKLPPANKDQRRLFAYLMKTRGLSQEIVHYFVHNKLIYEDEKHHNIVYCGRDPQGVVGYAGLRGTADYNGRTFKMDVPGNDKNYGVNIVNKESSELKVFEAVIDCMSYMDMFGDKTTNKLILGMVEDNPLAQFLKDYPHIKTISFCLDNPDIDAAAKKALYGDMSKPKEQRKPGLIEKYEALGYEVKVETPPHGKDYNESLLQMKNGFTEIKYKKNGPTEIKYKGYTIIQSTKNNHITVIKDGKKVFHVSCNEKKDEKGLQEIVDYILSKKKETITSSEIKNCLVGMAKLGYTLYESENNLVNPCFVHVSTLKHIGFDGWQMAIDELDNMSMFQENGQLRDEFTYMLELIKEHEKNVPGVARNVLNDVNGELAYGVRKPEFMEAFTNAEEWKKQDNKMGFVAQSFPRRNRR